MGRRHRLTQRNLAFPSRAVVALHPDRALEMRQHGPAVANLPRGECAEGPTLGEAFGTPMVALRPAELDSQDLGLGRGIPGHAPTIYGRRDSLGHAPDVRSLRVV